MATITTATVGRAAGGASVARRRAVLLVRGRILRARLALAISRRVLVLAGNALDTFGSLVVVDILTCAAACAAFFL